MPTVDSLDIQITAQATSAEKALDRLIAKLNTLSGTLGKVNSQSLGEFANKINEITNKTSGFGTASKNVSSGLSKIDISASRTTKSTKSLAAAFGKFYANYFLLVRGIKGLSNSIKSTADYIEAFNYFNVALGKVSSEWTKTLEESGKENAEAYVQQYADTLKSELGKLSGLNLEISADGTGLLTETGLKNLGLNIKEVTQYASQLLSVTNSVGQTGAVSLAAAEAFTKLGADMSSLFNIDYKTAMTNLQSGLIGQSRSLYKYGIDITNATLQTYAYELGLSKAVSEMTQAEKMQLRMIAILDQSKVSWGDLANTINSPSNMLRQFSNNLKETGMVLGQIFIPLLQKVLPVINGITIAIKSLLVNIAGLFGIKLDLSSFGQGYTDLEDGIDGVTDSYDDATAAAKKFKTTVLGIDELNINAPQQESGSATGGVGGGIDLTDEILNATSEYQKVWDEAYARMQNRAQEFADRISEILQPISDMFKHLSFGEFELAGGDLSDFIRQFLDIDWDSVYSKFSNFGTNLAEFLNGLINPELFGDVGTTIAGALRTAISSKLAFVTTFDWGNLGDSLAQAVNDFVAEMNRINPETGMTGWQEWAEQLNTLVDGVIDGLSTALKGINWVDVIDSAEDFLGNLELDTVAVVIGTAVVKEIGAVTVATTVLSSIGAKLGGVLTTIGGTLATALVGGITAKLGTTPIRNLITASIQALFGNEAAKSALTFMMPDFPALMANISGAFVALNPATIGQLGLTLEYMVKGSFLDASEWDNWIGTLITNVEKKLNEFADNIGKFLIFDRSESAPGFVNDLFNWDETLASFENAKKSWNEAMDSTWIEGKGVFGNDIGKNILESVGSAMNGVAGVIVEPIHDALNEAFEFAGLSDDISKLEKTVLDNFNSLGNGISEWYETSVKPLFSAEEWQALGQGIYDGISTKWEEFSTWWGETAMVSWWEEHVSPWFTFDKWTETTQGMQDGIKEKWDSTVGVWKKDIQDWWKNNVEPWFTKDTWLKATAGVVDGMKQQFKNAANAVIGIFNNLIDKINDIMSFDWSWTNPFSGKTYSGSAKLIELPHIQEFATGGFPEDGLFFANHNELVGQFSNGKTAVANNEQIVEGIKDGVKEAVSDILAPYLSEIAQNTRETADKDMSVNIGDRDIARANYRGQKALGRRLILEV